MKKLSKLIEQYSYCKKEVLDFYSKKGYSIDKISEYSAVTGIPLVAVYYFIYEKDKVKDSMDQINRLCEYYELESDIEST